MHIDGIEFEIYDFGIIKQKNPKSFNYSLEYLNSIAKTTAATVYLRLGCLLSFIPFDDLKSYRVLELGPGLGEFMTTIKDRCKRIEGYDVVDTKFNTITLDDLQKESWDLVCAFDALEHMEDIEDLWKIDFRYGMFSMPAPPKEGITKEWRHFKPGQHLWYITVSQFKEWATYHGYETLFSGCIEDVTRTRWDDDQININTFIIGKNNG